MKNINTFLFATCITAAVSAAAFAEGETVTIEFIPDAKGANDMSPDGRFIVGLTESLRPYLLRTDTMTMNILPLPAYDAVAVSDAGKVVLGVMPDPTTGAEVAALWSSLTQTWTSIGYLPDAMQCPQLSSAYELSADGKVAVGLSWDGCSGRGFRWTAETGMVELEVLANGGNRASVCSADGNVIGGFAQGSFSRTPAVWDGKGNGTLLDPPNGDALGEVHGINDDGSILLGEWNGDAVMWTGPEMSRTIIGQGKLLPGWAGIPLDVADDDGTVVGFDFLSGNRRAWIQPQGQGDLVELVSYIESHGGDVPAGVPLHVCQAITRDGTMIIGHGFNTGAWIVRITPREEETCIGDLVSSGTFQPPADGQVDGADLGYLLTEWGRNPGSIADMVDSGTFMPPPDGKVDGADLGVLLSSWGACQ